MHVVMLRLEATLLDKRHKGSLIKSELFSGTPNPEHPRAEKSCGFGFLWDCRGTYSGTSCDLSGETFLKPKPLLPPTTLAGGRDRITLSPDGPAIHPAGKGGPSCSMCVKAQ